jgi:hypothetical protein
MCTANQTHKKQATMAASASASASGMEAKSDKSKAAEKRSPNSENPVRMIGGDEMAMWNALGPLERCEHERMGPLYRVIYRSDTDYSIRALDLLSGLAGLNIIHYCPNLPKPLCEDIAMHSDNSEILKVIVRAGGLKISQSTTEEKMAIENMRIFRTYYPDCPIRLAKLFLIFLATSGVPSFTSKIRERTFSGSWSRLFMILYLKLDAFKFGRQLCVRGRRMLSDGRGAKRHKKESTPVAAAPAAAPLPTRPVSRVPAYCGLSHAVVDMCNLYD